MGRKYYDVSLEEIRDLLLDAPKGDNSSEWLYWATWNAAIRTVERVLLNKEEEE